MKLFNTILSFFRPKTNQYTVLYSCDLCRNCFRSVFAKNEAEARQWILENVPNALAVTEVRPYVGGGR